MKFSIYDGSNPRLLDNNEYEVEALNARKALQQYLDSKGQGNLKFRNTSDDDVVWKTTPFVERDGRKYLSGRISWWGLVPEKLK